MCLGQKRAHKKWEVNEAQRNFFYEPPSPIRFGHFSPHFHVQKKSKLKWPKVHQVIFRVIKHTHTHIHCTNCTMGTIFEISLTSMMIFEIKSGTFSKRGSGLILNFWSSSQLKLATNYEFVSKHHIFWTYTNKNPRFFLSFLVFRIGGPLCMLLPIWCLKVRTDVLITDESMDGLVCSKKCWNDALYALCEKICIWQNSAMGHNRWQMNSCESWGRFMKK